MSPYVRRKATLLVVIITALNTWAELTKAQKRDLLAAPTTMHPHVRERLYTMRLIRKDGRRSAWGNRVVKYATTKPSAVKVEETQP